MIKAETLVDLIKKEINSIMEVQERLGSETEAYKSNEEAIKMYMDMLNLIDESERKDRELDLRKMELNKEISELEMKAQELKDNSNVRLRSDIFDLLKTLMGFVMMKDLMDGLFEFEKTGVFTTKVGTPLIGTAVRLFTSIFSKK